MKTIKVTQTASEKFEPDGVVLALELRAENKKYGEAMRALREKADAANKTLSAAGLTAEEITTSGASVSSTHKEGKTVFCARMPYKVSLAMTDERMDGVLSAAESVGAEWSQQFVLRDSSHRTALLQKAVAGAREAAQTLADAAGVRLGTLASMEYASSFGGGRVMRAMAYSGDAASPEPIEASETVTCEWDIA